MCDTLKEFNGNPSYGLSFNVSHVVSPYYFYGETTYATLTFILPNDCVYHGFGNTFSCDHFSFVDMDSCCYGNGGWDLQTNQAVSERRKSDISMIDLATKTANCWPF